MRILVSNDDGIHARGLESMVRIARALSDDVWVVAPHEEQSGAARSLSLANPIRIRKYHERRYSVFGTPTDAVQMAVTKLMADKKPDLVLSGVNNGQNLADDVTFSGTIAAALQGMTLGIPSIALSLARFSRESARWATPERHGPAIIRRLIAAGWPADVVINVNFPDRDPDDVAGVEITAQGRRDALSLFAEEREDLRGGRYYWFGFSGKLSDPPAGTDLRAVYDGRISITPLHLSLTHTETLSALTKAFPRDGAAPDEDGPHAASLPQIRPGVAADTPAIAAFDRFAGDRAREIAEGRLIVAEQDGALAGYVAFAPFGFNGCDFISYLCVADGYRRRGVGRALIGAAEAALHDPRIFISTEADNDVMRDLLAGAGWTYAGAVTGANDSGAAELFFYKDRAAAAKPEVR